MRRLLLPCLLLATLVLTACGFHLRGSFSLPYDTIYIALPESNMVRATLKRNIEASTKTRVVNEAKEAQAVMTVISDVPVKNILSINSAGRVAEYELVRTFTYRLADNKGNELAPTSTIRVRRDVTYSDSAVLSKEAEENLLWRDMETDLVQQLLRRLAAKPKPAEESEQG
jgi:LPS-assembly lipoprotein